MSERLTTRGLAEVLASQTGMDRKRAEDFIDSLALYITQSLERNKIVKIFGFGVFKILLVRERESIHIQTGERFVIPAHHKITFIPDKEFKEQINRPFALFEPIETTDIEAADIMQNLKLQTSNLPSDDNFDSISDDSISDDSISDDSLSDDSLSDDSFELMPDAKDDYLQTDESYLEFEEPSGTSPVYQTEDEMPKPFLPDEIEPFEIKVNDPAPLPVETSYEETQPRYEEPRYDDPQQLYEKPLIDELLTGEVLNGELLNDDPQQLYEEPLVDELLTDDPQPLYDDPLVDELLNDNQQPLYDDPLVDELLTDELLTDELLNDDPQQLYDDPQQPYKESQQPYKESLIEEPLIEEPLIEEPSIHESTIEEPQPPYDEPPIAETSQPQPLNGYSTYKPEDQMINYEKKRKKLLLWLFLIIPVCIILGIGVPMYIFLQWSSGKTWKENQPPDISNTVSTVNDNAALPFDDESSVEGDLQYPASNDQSTPDSESRKDEGSDEINRPTSTPTSTSTATPTSTSTSTSTATSTTRQNEKTGIDWLAPSPDNGKPEVRRADKPNQEIEARNREIVINSRQSQSKNATKTPANSRSASAAPPSTTPAPATNAATSGKTLPARVRMPAGSTLMQLAMDYYGDKVFWVYIYEHNKSRIKNYNNVPVGTELQLPAASTYNIDPNSAASKNRALQKQRELFR